MHRRIFGYCAWGGVLEYHTPYTMLYHGERPWCCTMVNGRGHCQCHCKDKEETSEAYDACYIPLWHNRQPWRPAACHNWVSPFLYRKQAKSITNEGLSIIQLEDFCGTVWSFCIHTGYGKMSLKLKHLPAGKYSSQTSVRYWCKFRCAEFELWRSHRTRV